MILKDFFMSRKVANKRIKKNKRKINKIVIKPKNVRRHDIVDF